MFRRAQIVGSIWAALFTLSSSAAIAGSAVPSALIRQNETIPGDPVGDPIFNFNGLTVNHSGGYAALINTDSDPTPATNLTGHFWGSATAGPAAHLRTEQTIGDYQQNTFEFFFGLSETGDLVYSVTTTHLPTAQNRDTVWFNDTLLMAARDSMPSPIETLFSSSNNRPGITVGGTPYWVTLTSTTAGGSASNAALLFGSTPTVLLHGGATIDEGALTLLNNTQTVGNPYRFSANGTHYIVSSRLTGGTATDGVMVVDGNSLKIDGMIVREGSPVAPSAGALPGENWFDAFDFMGINEAGDYFLTGDTQAATTQDEFVIKNGVIVLREGQTVGSDTFTGAIDGGYMNENGDWAVIWLVAGTPNLEALVFNGEVLLRAREPVDWNGDGLIDALDNNGRLNEFFTGSLAVGDRDANGAVDIYFFGEIDFNGTFGEGTADDDDLLGYFRLRVTPPAACTRGDVDNNAAVNSVDIGAFLGVLLDPDAATTQQRCAADVNLDSFVDGQDISGFAACVIGGGCP